MISDSRMTEDLHSEKLSIVTGVETIGIVVRLGGLT